MQLFQSFERRLSSLDVSFSLNLGCFGSVYRMLNRPFLISRTVARHKRPLSSLISISVFSSSPESAPLESGLSIDTSSMLTRRSVSLSSFQLTVTASLPMLTIVAG